MQEQMQTHISEALSMGVNGSTTNWYKYDVSSGKFLPVNGQLNPKEKPVTLPAEMTVDMNN